MYWLVIVVPVFVDQVETLKTSTFKRSDVSTLMKVLGTLIKFEDKGLVNSANGLRHIDR
jgi:hypothetical protein